MTWETYISLLTLAMVLLCWFRMPAPQRKYPGQNDTPFLYFVSFWHMEKAITP